MYYFKDQLIVRFWETKDGCEDNIEADKVTSTDMLQEIDLDRYKSKIGEEKWGRIRYFQTCLKHRTGVGMPIVIEYYAPAPVSLDKPLKYDYRSVGDDLTMLRQKDYVGYCTKQVVKMCYYVQKMYNFEILKIRAEFAMDKNETIWF